ncbi:inositol monophosphatase/fructose-1,6-bisphosphatase family protein [Rivularia sp. PCC 7116]|uniref:inositol monophosphatase family protein n=1 Tax=Rivularia sp. PCC 7116 TaxID=373994 RepID=UPI00029F48B1|nr:inositol monophosphatase family protein [Rivularia sp. PCC 7116]AFY55656.1 inositol monophosphatase/fructose-1,6-bisphosphatase family protein [Rivularia sp. PCC 7116]
MPSPRTILETLLPHLKAAAGYARFLQPKIAALPDKDGGESFFSAALTEADLAIQNFVEVALLGNFPNIRFYGEEYKSSPNTKYFRAVDLGEKDDYLVTLDPIDGTKYYIDGHSNYQIILSILNTDDYEAVIAISPSEDTYFYALRGEGAFKGNLKMDLSECTPLKVDSTAKPTILLGTSMSSLTPTLKDKYNIINAAEDYSSSIQMPNLNSILTGGISGALKRFGQFIDGAALAFIAKEAGCMVTSLDGSALPPLSECSDYKLPGLIIATSESVHQDLLAAISKII